jgi:hypothetical protein
MRALMPFVAVDRQRFKRLVLGMSIVANQFLRKWRRRRQAVPAQDTRTAHTDRSSVWAAFERPKEESQTYGVALFQPTKGNWLAASLLIQSELGNEVLELRCGSGN